MSGTLFRQIVVTFHLLPHLNGQSSRLTYRLFIMSLDFCRMTACALVQHFQPRFIISECCTRYRTHLYNVFLDYYQCHLWPYNPVHTCFHVYVTTFTCENKDVNKSEHTEETNQTLTLSWTSPSKPKRIPSTRHPRVNARRTKLREAAFIPHDGEPMFMTASVY